mmetsp:Transcript_60799/g.107954  ORF Transcript_60799/g.107954 Transcript_60799/m.107954 type:complete len:229 (-) Transcript_60799:775-1461(-)
MAGKSCTAGGGVVQVPGGPGRNSADVIFIAGRSKGAASGDRVDAEAAAAGCGCFRKRPLRADVSAVVGASVVLVPLLPTSSSVGKSSFFEDASFTLSCRRPPAGSAQRGPSLSGKDEFKKAAPDILNSPGGGPCILDTVGAGTGASILSPFVGLGIGIPGCTFLMCSFSVLCRPNNDPQIGHGKVPSFGSFGATTEELFEGAGLDGADGVFVFDVDEDAGSHPISVDP